jgi:hypothetical protein
MAEKYVSPLTGGCNSAHPAPTSTPALAGDVLAALGALTAVTRDHGTASPAADQAAAAAMVQSFCNVLLIAPDHDASDRAAQQMGAVIRAIVATQDAATLAAFGATLSVLRTALPSEPPVALVIEMLDAADAYLDTALARAGIDREAFARNALATRSLGQAERPLPQTEVSFAFSRVSRDLDTCVSAYRMIQRDVVPNVFAPEFAPLLSAAETALDELTDGLSELACMAPTRDLDRPLIAMAHLLHRSLGVEDDGDRAYVANGCLELEDLMLVRGADPVARRLRSAQRHFFRSAQALMSLPDFSGEAPSLGDNDGDINIDWDLF